MGGVREHAMARLAERQTEERAMVRDLTKRLDAAQAATVTARAALVDAEAARAAVLVEWARHPGWNAEVIAEHTGLPLAEVNAAVRPKRRRTPGPERAAAG